MQAVDIIVKKRDKGELTRDEIDWFVTGYTSGEIPDYQAAAWAMAVLLNGMTRQETIDLTLSMIGRDVGPARYGSRGRRQAFYGWGGRQDDDRRRAAGCGLWAAGGQDERSWTEL